MSINKFLFFSALINIALTFSREILVVTYSTWSQSDSFYLKISFFQIVAALAGDAFSRTLLSKAHNTAEFHGYHYGLYILCLPVTILAIFLAILDIKSGFYLLSLSAAITACSLQVIAKSKTPYAIILFSLFPPTSSLIYIIATKDPTYLFEWFAFSNAASFFLCSFCISISTKCHATSLRMITSKGNLESVTKNLLSSSITQITTMIERPAAILIGEGALSQVYLMRRIASIPHMLIMPIVNSSILSNSSKINCLYKKYEAIPTISIPLAAISIAISPFAIELAHRSGIEKTDFLATPQWIIVFFITLSSSCLRSMAQITGPLLNVSEKEQIKINFASLILFFITISLGLLLKSPEVLAMGIPFYGLAIWAKTRRKYA